MKALSSAEVLGGAEDKFTVGLKHSDRSVTRLLKVIYSLKDCSYFVSFPYHAYRGQAVLAKYTINYTKDKSILSSEEMLDIASAGDKSNAIKLSHHPDGLVQFSGGGIISGPGNSGVNVRSWSLSNPAPGPAFAVSFFSLENYSKKPISDVACIFEDVALSPNKENGVLIVEGFYFPLDAKEHTQRNAQGERVITVERPKDGRALQFKVLTPPGECWNLGFVGLRLDVEPVSESQQMTGFVVTTASGNIRTNSAGETLGDCLMLGYPNIVAARRSLDYKG